jgi:hypothetical protein
MLIGKHAFLINFTAEIIADVYKFILRNEIVNVLHEIKSSDALLAAGLHINDAILCLWHH